MRSAGLFTLFTTTLLGAHVQLILRNQTTVESLAVSEMRERERAGLGGMFAWHQIGCVPSSPHFRCKKRGR